jgi:DNA-binding HxlR family transcriptional regulator
MLKVTVDDYIRAEDCPFRNVLDKVGDKWSFLIFAVLEDGPKRFNEVERLIGDISHRVLARKLRDLGPALKRAIAVVKKGEPALVEVVSQGR